VYYITLCIILYNIRLSYNFSNFLLRLADDMIKESMAKGDFDNLPGIVTCDYCDTMSILCDTSDM